jgi:hypothetical protein
VRVAEHHARQHHCVGGATTTLNVSFTIKIACICKWDVIVIIQDFLFFFFLTSKPLLVRDNSSQTVVPVFLCLLPFNNRQSFRSGIFTKKKLTNSAFVYCKCCDMPSAKLFAENQTSIV